jgi:hypothetical protein
VAWDKDEIPAIENFKKFAKLAQEFSEQFLASFYAIGKKHLCE